MLTVSVLRIRLESALDLLEPPHAKPQTQYVHAIWTSPKGLSHYDPPVLHSPIEILPLYLIQGLKRKIFAASPDLPAGEALGSALGVARGWWISQGVQNFSIERRRILAVPQLPYL